MHAEEETDRDSVGDVIPSVVRLSSTSLASTSSSGSGSDPRPKTVTPTPGVYMELGNWPNLLTKFSLRWLSWKTKRNTLAVLLELLPSSVGTIETDRLFWNVTDLIYTAVEATKDAWYSHRSLTDVTCPWTHIIFFFSFFHSICPGLWKSLEATGCLYP